MPKSKLLVFLFFVACLSVLFLPVFIFSYLYPSIDELQIQDTEEVAERIASHLIEFFEAPDGPLRSADISSGLKDKIFQIQHNFSLEKVKIFSSTGEVIFSTSPEDIGTKNTKDYFNVLVLRGHNFTKLVKEDTKTLEGRKVTIDVIETYVPILGQDTVIGAFEIYYNVTSTREKFDALVRRTSVIVFCVSTILFVSLVVSLVLLARNMAARDQAEKLLAKHRDELELLVKQRTAEITAVNVQLTEDIKKRIETENALQISEEKFRSLVELASDAIFIADADTGIITDVNKEGTELVGREASDLVGRHLTCLHPSEELYNRLTENNYTMQLPPNQILHVLHISGKKVPVDISANIIELGQKRIVQGIFRNISERLQFENELQKTEKVKTASVLAGGIAHDFNNLLTAVLGNISLAKREAEHHEKIHRRLAETEKAIGRAKDLTRQLLTFSKGGAPDKKVIHLGALIEESSKFVLRGSKVRCECTLPDILWPVEVDEGQMSQVINNLVINASHSMDEGGVCAIRAENVMLDRASGVAVTPGRYVKIAVEDTGHGIPPEKINKIFDPFYTTKTQGSGLGLSSTYTIVKNHGGHVTVESEVGKGTVFNVYLPVSSAGAVREQITEPEEEDLQGEGRVLVMDDEDIVREAVTSLLQYLGYEVDTAMDGQEAINMYGLSMSLGSPYDVVIMDLTVPGGMGGKEAVQKIREVDPNVKVIVSSGYYTDPVLSNYKEYGFDGVVPKPYQVEELGRVVKEIIAS